jgi:hypothetical protein
MEGVEIIMEEYEVLFHWHNIDQMIYQDLGPRRQQRRQHPRRRIRQRPQRGINWKDGYAAMKTDAEVTPYNNFDPEDQTGSTKEGRGALPDWLAYGYITPNFTRSVSKTVEYALNDFS